MILNFHVKFVSQRLQATRLFLCRVNPELGAYQHLQQSSLNTLECVQIDVKLFHSSSPCWAFALSSRKRLERWSPLVPQD